MGDAGRFEPFRISAPPGGDRTVSFTVDGAAADSTLTWSSGSLRADLELRGDCRRNNAGAGAGSSPHLAPYDGAAIDCRASRAGRASRTSRASRGSRASRRARQNRPSRRGWAYR